ncbi:glycoside hydrolase family 31 protein [Caldibacillus lycopersici]|uniref:Glycoside hydrolase family 31 protein n=1 Tax=Perspicuibacillus lycopersici TaxID=1325689 RepID=A0AAE3ITJ0_9BACI|nr:glycoside hydrolase family 31 protein [Perspicuibacillus lycopersici]MCU9612464.1 glycoside hydrolase family 31 protein [Perspicuibacillus lycopersici]
MLEDTSFAIHPEKTAKMAKENYLEIGDIKSYIHSEGKWNLTCTNGNVLIEFYTNEIIKIEMVPFGKNAYTNSKAVVLETSDVAVQFTENETELLFKSNTLQLKITRNAARVYVYDNNGNLLTGDGEKGMRYKHTGEVLCYQTMEANDHFYGFGEKTGFLNKRGEKLTMWNSDVYAPHNPETDPLYQSIPFFIAFRDGIAHGVFFDNPSRTVIDLRSEENYYSYEADAGTLSYYVFAGPTMKKVIEQYTELTGRMPLPPKWAIGYHQSRYSYETDEEVLELVQNFTELEIPLDAIHLDIHYMNEYRVFTFDYNRFTNPKQLIKQLKEKGIHVIPIVDPGVKEDPEYLIYQEGVKKGYFCKYMEGNIYFGDVWPGNSAFPDFTNEEVRKWWGEKHEFYKELGIEGIWNDMNEPAVFNETKTMDVKVIHGNDGEPKTHRELHNLYGLMMSKATYEGMKDQLKGKRPFVLTRAGYSGVQRYAAVWTGDNRSFWEHLQMSLPMVMNLGLSGVPFAGPDVGGFAHDTNGELLARWTQVGAFTPFFRNHSAIGTLRQEPWAFGEKYRDIIKKYIQLRYQWLPQLYSLFAESSRTGLPILRPLVLEYPNDPKTYNLNDQFMIGDNVIVAPILQPSVTDRALYLPEGRWVNYWTDEVLEGGKHQLIHADLDVLPIFIKEGTFIVNGPFKQNAGVKDNQLTIHFYPSESSKYEFALYEDDGETFEYEKGNFMCKKLQVECNGENIYLSITDDGLFVPTWKLQLLVHNGDCKSVYLNGKKLPEVDDNLYVV